MDDLLTQFLLEAAELTEQAGNDLVALERSPANVGLIDSAFRAIHTLKGSVGLFDLASMSEVLHAAEDVLGALRDGTLRSDAGTIDRLLACVAQTERWTEALRRAETLPDDAPAVAFGLTTELRACLSPGPAPTEPTTHLEEADWAAALAKILVPAEDGALVAVRYTPDRQAYFNGEDPLATVSAVPGLAGLSVGLRESAAGDYNPFECNLRLELVSSAPLDDVRAAFRFLVGQVEIALVPAGKMAQPPAEEGTAEAIIAGRSMRIDPARIDALAQLIDELVVAKNSLAQLAMVQESLSPAERARRLQQSVAGIGSITSSLHRGVMQARMTPFAPVFRRLPRLTREIASSLGKSIDLRLEGQDVGADKTVVDGIYEPLLHLLRNSVDHGVETPEERVRSGKPARATITLRAAAAGQQVALSVLDDGRGVDPARVRDTARKRGLMTDAQLAALSDQAAIELIFAPGFSTAETVGALSGRGVGMDAVRAAVARLGGRVSLASTLGRGTTVELTLPLTMVMSQILLVACGQQRFGVALDGVLETIRLAPDRINPVRHGRAFVLRDRAIPLVALSELLGLGASAASGEDCTVLVASCGGEPIGVSVDKVLSRTDAVLRPMSGLLAGLPGLAGTTLMGDGSVLMVLDFEELTA